MSRLLVAGIGNESCGDDAAGLLAIRRLRDLGVDGVDVEEHCDPASLVSALLKHSHVVVVDSVAGGGEPGTVLELVPEDSRLRAPNTSHGLDVRHAVELARALGAAPAVMVLGIVGRDFGLGDAPSRAVVQAATEVANRIKGSLACV